MPLSQFDATSVSTSHDCDAGPDARHIADGSFVSRHQASASSPKVLRDLATFVEEFNFWRSGGWNP